MKLDKKQTRLRRARKARAKIRELAANRLSVHRTPRHIYAQIIAADGAKVLASASTLEKDVRKSTKGTGNAAAAAIVGLHRFLNRNRYFTGLAVAEADTSVAVAHDSQCRKAELPSAFHDFGDSIHRNEFLQKVVGALCLVHSCHI